MEFEFLFVGVVVQLVPVPQWERSRNKLSKENETLIPILKSQMIRHKWLNSLYLWTDCMKRIKGRKSRKVRKEMLVFMSMNTMEIIKTMHDRKHLLA